MRHPSSHTGFEVENTSESTFEERQQGGCPEINSDRNSGNVPHLTTYMLPEKEAVAVRSECKECGEFLGEWDSKEKAVAATPEHEFGVCPACNETAWENRVAGRRENGELWHKACWYMDQYGFEKTGDDPPIGPREGRPFDLHRSSTVEIAGERFEWDEYLYLGKENEYASFNLPTRDELRVDQLEQLRKWAVTDNPTGSGENDEQHSSFHEFPAEFVLLGDYEDRASDSWVCPDCGSIVDPTYESKEFAKSQGVDLEARCTNCGSDEWITRGNPLDSHRPG